MNGYFNFCPCTPTISLFIVKAEQYVLMIEQSRTMNMKRIRPIPLHFISIFQPFHGVIQQTTFTL